MFEIVLNLGGRGDGPADASKVKASGPGLEKGGVMPGRPTNLWWIQLKPVLLLLLSI